MRQIRRRKKRGHTNSERWLVSYADLVTLLFAFFVVLFASTQTDKTRARQISQAVNDALQESSFGAHVAAVPGSAKADAGNDTAQRKGAAAWPPLKTIKKTPLELDLTGAIHKLETTLGSEIKQGQVSVHLEPRGAVISLNTQAVFPSGGDTIADAIYPLLAKLSATLNQLPNPVRLEGHTDSLPIRNERFHSNWELSAARSIAMLRTLNERYGVNRERMAIVGYGDTNAQGDNQTEAGRMKNRRVDLVILSDLGAKGEPRPASERDHTQSSSGTLAPAPAAARPLP